MHATQNTTAHSTLLTLLRYSLYQRYPPYSRYVFYSLHYSAPTSQYHPTSPYISLYLNQCADLTFMVMPVMLGLIATSHSHAAAFGVTSVCGLGATAAFWRLTSKVR